MINLFLRRIRIALASFTFICLIALFLDFTGTLAPILGWLAQIQFLPVVLSGSIILFVLLVAMTLIFGRIYCSVICPLGILQDIISHITGYFKRNRFAYRPAWTLVRYAFLSVYLIALLFGLGIVTALLAPYGTFGLILSQTLTPLYRLGNNALAYLAQRADSYAFYTIDIPTFNPVIFGIAIVLLLIITIFAIRTGRLYCNTLCPVGTLLGTLSRYAYLRPVINTAKCTGCSLCALRCKSACINVKTHLIDTTRCVTCFDCIDTCPHSAIDYAHLTKPHLTHASGVPDAQRSPAGTSSYGYATRVSRTRETTEPRSAEPQSGAQSRVSSGSSGAHLTRKSGSGSSDRSRATDWGSEPWSSRSQADPACLPSVQSYNRLPPPLFPCIPFPFAPLRLSGRPSPIRTIIQSSPSRLLPRKAFITGAAFLGAATLANAQNPIPIAEKVTDGGLADLIDKKPSPRRRPLHPAGSQSLSNFTTSCTGCQLCVNICPNSVLRPSLGLFNITQPEMSYERGFCRPECVKCSEVCPAGAIQKITVPEKSSIQIGTAQIFPNRCLIDTEGVPCGNCSRQCPTGAILMVHKDGSAPDALPVPAVDPTKCIGCGACEYTCPVRPVSAIIVDGILVHHTL